MVLLSLLLWLYGVLGKTWTTWRHNTCARNRKTRRLRAHSTMSISSPIMASLCEVMKTTNEKKEKQKTNENLQRTAISIKVNARYIAASLFQHAPGGCHKLESAGTISLEYLILPVVGVLIEGVEARQQCPQKLPMVASRHLLARSFQRCACT